MDNLLFLMNFQRIQDTLQNPQQIQLFKQTLTNNNSTSSISSFPLIQSASYAPSQMDSNQGFSYFPPTANQFMNQPSIAQGINQFSQQIQKPDNIIQCLEQAAEEHNRQQKQFLEEITSQHDHMIQIIDQFAKDKEKLERKVSELEHLVEEKMKERQSQNSSSSSKEIPKKNRRRVEEINRDKICPYEDCSKKYGSEISLNLHIKLKHNGGSKTERESLAVKSLSSSNQQYQAPSL